MDGLIQNIKMLNEQTDTKYVIKPEVSIDIEGYFGDIDILASDLHYDIEIEHRSWGIKGIELILPKQYELEYAKEDKSDYKTLKLDLSQSHIDWNIGSSYRPTKINIYLDKNEQIKDVSIDAFFVEKQ